MNRIFLTFVFLSFIRQVCVVREMGGWYNGERYSGVVSRETVKM